MTGTGTGAAPDSPDGHVGWTVIGSSPHFLTV
jgi:hypothetical protein